jgi:S1-C subfamily serine protease
LATKEIRIRLRPALALVLLVLLAATIGGAAGGLTVRLLGEDKSETPSPSAATGEPPVVLAEDAAVIDVVQRAEPSVVTITNQMEPSRDESGILREESAVGSGVIIDEDGFIVTNEHVISDAVRLTVRLYDGEERAAAVVSADDPFTDLAVIKIERGGLKALPWGDSDALQLGEKVVAIGSALSEFHGSVTVGVVSGLHRRWLRDGVMMEDLVQTDAAINHGNSGGALLNSRGEMVGLNSNVVRSTDTGEVVEGVAFAISSKVATPIVDAIIKEGSYPRAYLGIAHQDIDEQTASYDLPTDHGAVVVSVSPDTPAGEAGIKEGDVILSMGDIELTSDMPFLNALALITPGETEPVLLNRGGEEITVQVTFTARER